MASIPFHLQGEDGGEVLFHHPLARLLDGLSDQTEDWPNRARKGVEFGLALPTLMVNKRPALMGAARKPMQGLCDLHCTKLLRPVRTRIFLNQRGDSQHDGDESLGLDARDTKPRQRDASPSGGRHALQPSGNLRWARFFEEEYDGAECRFDKPIRLSPEPNIRGRSRKIRFQFGRAICPVPV